MIKKFVLILTIINLLLSGILPYENVFAQEQLILPPVGKILPLSPEFTPLMIKGLKIHKDDPFEFDFIINQGEENLPENQFKEESLKLVKYFLASLAIPENDLWVNLSPYEKNRITTPELGITGMGKDLLSQDYVLKQLTSSLIYPEGETGKRFWSKVYALAEEKYHTTNVPINTFNKVWIVPEKAVVYENTANQTAYVLESKLKVMLEEDYLALQKHSTSSPLHPHDDIHSIGANIIREIVIPELTKEVNYGHNFANLRQITNSLILAAWFKRTLKAGILGKLYVDQKKVSGVDLEDRTVAERIFQQYLKAYKKGVYNYIKEEEDPVSHEIIPRKYFSGGVVERFVVGKNLQVDDFVNPAQIIEKNDRAVTVQLDNAMETPLADLVSVMTPDQVKRTQDDPNYLRSILFNSSDGLIRKKFYKYSKAEAEQIIAQKGLNSKLKVIVGGGPQGLSLAEHFINQGYKVILVTDKVYPLYTNGGGAFNAQRSAAFRSGTYSLEGFDPKEEAAIHNMVRHLPEIRSLAVQGRNAIRPLRDFIGLADGHDNPLKLEDGTLPAAKSELWAYGLKELDWFNNQAQGLVIESASLKRKPVFDEENNVWDLQLTNGLHLNPEDVFIGTGFVGQNAEHVRIPRNLKDLPEDQFTKLFTTQDIDTPNRITKEGLKQKPWVISETNLVDPVIEGDIRDYKADPISVGSFKDLFFNGENIFNWLITNKILKGIPDEEGIVKSARVGDDTDLGKVQELLKSKYALDQQNDIPEDKQDPDLWKKVFDLLISSLPKVFLAGGGLSAGNSIAYIHGINKLVVVIVATQNGFWAYPSQMPTGYRPAASLWRTLLNPNDRQRALEYWKGFGTPVTPPIHNHITKSTETGTTIQKTGVHFTENDFDITRTANGILVTRKPTTTDGGYSFAVKGIVAAIGYDPKAAAKGMVDFLGEDNIGLRPDGRLDLDPNLFFLSRKNRHLFILGGTSVSHPIQTSYHSAPIIAQIISYYLKHGKLPPDELEDDQLVDKIIGDWNQLDPDLPETAKQKIVLAANQPGNDLKRATSNYNPNTPILDLTREAIVNRVFSLYLQPHQTKDSINQLYDFVFGLSGENPLATEQLLYSYVQFGKEDEPAHVIKLFDDFKRKGFSIVNAAYLTRAAREYLPPPFEDHAVYFPNNREQSVLIGSLKGAWSGFVVNVLSERLSYLQSAGKKVNSITVNGAPVLLKTDKIIDKDPYRFILRQLPQLQNFDPNREFLLKEEKEGVFILQFADKAATATVAKPFEKGGIDLNTSNLDLQIKHDGQGIPLALQFQHLENIHINGLSPVIINIAPIADLSAFLGVK